MTSLGGPVHPYLSAAYAETFGPGWEPLHLPATGVWVLRRSIPGTPYVDAMGCYPILPLPVDGDRAAWTAAWQADRAVLADAGIVSLVAVTDVLLQPDRATLELAFDHVAPFKEHYVRDLTLREEHPYTRHHRYYVNRALRTCTVAPFTLTDRLGEWCAMYDVLVERHGISGVQAFGPSYFAALAAVPGLVTLGAFVADELVSAHLWFRVGDLAYAHLAASSAEGYARRASYPIYDAAIRRFAASGAVALDLGGGAGAAAASAGLAQFKEGFATERRANSIVGIVVDRARYAELSGPAPASAFFPAYRAPAA